MVERVLDTATLKQAAADYAAMFIKNTAPFDRDFVMKNFYNFTYKDEFEYLVAEIKKHLGPVPLADFEAKVAALEPRSDEVFHRLLEEKRPAGYTPKGV